ncbi:MAG: NADH:ubiquinone reductase (Na(+)-transporting) subunit C [Rikenellaceae bacterium]
MDTNKNLYTIIYSTILVVVVAVVLALASYLLKDKQQRNVEIETKQMILKSVHLGGEAETVADKATYIEQEYAKYIKDSSIAESGKNLPIYICTSEALEKYYIVPLHGTGLWGAIWGYISLKSDFSTVYGAIFDHKSETPGLGAEIATPGFSNQFTDKQMFENGDFVSILVVKGGAAKDNPHQVDAISGGTITSKGVEAMLKSSIGDYLNFFKANLNSATQTLPASDSTLLNSTDSTKLTPLKVINSQKVRNNQKDTTKN